MILTSAQTGQLVPRGRREENANLSGGKKVPLQPQTAPSNAACVNDVKMPQNLRNLYLMSTSQFVKKTTSRQSNWRLKAEKKMPKSTRRDRPVPAEFHNNIKIGHLERNNEFVCSCASGHVRLPSRGSRYTIHRTTWVTGVVKYNTSSLPLARRDEQTRCGGAAAPSPKQGCTVFWTTGHHSTRLESSSAMQQLSPQLLLR